MKIISKNKKALHDYEILSTLQVGIVLNGSEVKSCRSFTGVQIQGSYVTIQKGILKLLNCNIPEYENVGYEKHDSLRERTLLAHKNEILKLSQDVMKKGLTLIPLANIFRQKFY